MASRFTTRGASPHPFQKPFLLYGVLCFVFGMAMYLAGVLLVFPRYLLNLHALLDPVAELLVWYSGVPILLGIVLALFDLLYMHQHKKPNVPVQFQPVRRRRVTVALTAYNDEDSIAGAVEDFLVHPLVERVIVVSNNSADRTFERAEAAGALTFNETAPGYGRCVFRCLTEAARSTTPNSSCCARATARFAPTISKSCWPMPRTPTSSTAPAPSSRCGSI